MQIFESKMKSIQLCLGRQYADVVKLAAQNPIETIQTWFDDDADNGNIKNH